MQTKEKHNSQSYHSLFLINRNEFWNNINWRLITLFGHKGEHC